MPEAAAAPVMGQCVMLGLLPNLIDNISYASI